MVLISSLLSFGALPFLLASAHPASLKNDGVTILPRGSHGTVSKEIAARWDGDIDHISYGDGWCVSFSKVPVFGRILWRLATNVVGDFESSGLRYARAQGGKWTVEIKRVVVNNGYSDPAYIQAAWERLKSGTFVRSGEVYYVGEHTMASIGQYGSDGEEANRIEVWITAVTAWGPEYYEVLKNKRSEIDARSGSINGTTYEGGFTYPNIKIDEKYLEEHVWKGPDPVWEAHKAENPIPHNPPKKSDSPKNKLSKRAKYWDSCAADDDNMEYYNRVVDTSVQDCMWMDTNNQYWSAEKYSFPNLWSSFPCSQNKDLCCNPVCTRDGSACCPYGQVC
ncbi:hypothetical protein ABW20_dc0106029 [Dactylellina cionopaga]|nr:hypothetical protein ABW20_dc0106029 [Dactylellina cionopaga]